MVLKMFRVFVLYNSGEKETSVALLTTMMVEEKTGVGGYVENRTIYFVFLQKWTTILVKIKIKTF